MASHQLGSAPTGVRFPGTALRADRDRSTANGGVGYRIAAACGSPAAAISSVSIWPLCSSEIAAHSALVAIGARPARPRKCRARRPEETSVGLRSCSQGNDQAVLEILCSTPTPSTASPSRSPNAAARAASSADRRRELKRPPWQSRSNRRAVPPGAHRQGLRRPSRPASRPRRQIKFS